MTNSRVKFVMVVDSSNTALRDNEIRSVSQGRCRPGLGRFVLFFPLCLEMLRGQKFGSSREYMGIKTLLVLVSDVPEAAQLLHRCDVQPLLQPGGPHPVQVGCCPPGFATFCRL